MGACNKINTTALFGWRCIVRSQIKVVQCKAPSPVQQLWLPEQNTSTGGRDTSWWPCGEAPAAHSDGTAASHVRGAASPHLRRDCLPRRSGGPLGGSGLGPGGGVRRRGRLCGQRRRRRPGGGRRTRLGSRGRRPGVRRLAAGNCSLVAGRAAGARAALQRWVARVSKTNGVTVKNSENSRTLRCPKSSRNTGTCGRVGGCWLHHDPANFYSMERDFDGIPIADGLHLVAPISGRSTKGRLGSHRLGVTTRCELTMLDERDLFHDVVALPQFYPAGRRWALLFHSARAMHVAAAVVTCLYVRWDSRRPMHCRCMTQGHASVCSRISQKPERRVAGRHEGCLGARLGCGRGGGGGSGAGGGGEAASGLLLCRAPLRHRDALRLHAGPQPLLEVPVTCRMPTASMCIKRKAGSLSPQAASFGDICASPLYKHKQNMFATCKAMADIDDVRKHSQDINSQVQLLC